MDDPNMHAYGDHYPDDSEVPGAHPPPDHPLSRLAARLGELLDEDHWAECESLLLKACADAKRLDFLDGNLRMKMGWNVGCAPAGNLSVSSVIQPSGPTSIRTAIDAAMTKPHNA